MSLKAFRYEATIGPEGKVEISVPLPAGTPVEVVILGPEQDSIDDFLHAAASSTAFWDNPLDDEDWNNA